MNWCKYIKKIKEMLQKIFSVKNDLRTNHKVATVLGIKIKFYYNKDRNYPFIKRMHVPDKYKYIHVMNNGIHSVNIIKFMNKYFDSNEHCFIFPFVMLSKTKSQLPPNLKNVFYTPLNNVDIHNINKIIIHGLFDSLLINFLYKNKQFLKKTYWFIWGGDLYAAKNTKADNYVRKHLTGIITAFDKEVYEKKYGKCKKFYYATYPHDMTEDMIVKNNKDKNYIHIQVNNSADETTLEMLDILSKFKNEPIKISTILSYKTVGQKDVQMQIMKKGYETFKDKFNPIIEFMPKEKFANHLASVDIYISNQNRQQGNGNASFVCAFGGGHGGKVFTKKGTSVYEEYNKLGIKYFDTDTIKNLSFDEFVAYDLQTKEKTIALLKERMKDETKVRQWDKVFEN